MGWSNWWNKWAWRLLVTSLIFLTNTFSLSGWRGLHTIALAQNLPSAHPKDSDREFPRHPKKKTVDKSVECYEIIEKNDCWSDYNFWKYLPNTPFSWCRAIILDIVCVFSFYVLCLIFKSSHSRDTTARIGEPLASFIVIRSFIFQNFIGLVYNDIAIMAIKKFLLFLYIWKTTLIR